MALSARRTEDPQATAAQQSRNVEASKQVTKLSKAASKQNTAFRTPEGKRQLDSELQKKSTP